MGSIGIGYGVVTVGRRDRAVTIGTSVGYRNHDVPIVNVVWTF